MRTLLAILALWLVACGPAPMDMPLGGRDVTVAIVDCIEPQRGWIAAEIQSFGWHVSEVGEVDVRCADTGPAGGVEEFDIGSNEVRFDPTKGPGLFEARSSSGHGLFHWRISKGPHPERARWHVCWYAYNESPPPNCFPGAVAQYALMSPGGASEPGTDWFTEVYTGPVAEYRVTPADQDMIDAALRP